MPSRLQSSRTCLARRDQDVAKSNTTNANHMRPPTTHNAMPIQPMMRPAVANPAPPSLVAAICLRAWYARTMPTIDATSEMIAMVLVVVVEDATAYWPADGVPYAGGAA